VRTRFVRVGAQGLVGEVQVTFDRKVQGATQIAKFVHAHIAELPIRNQLISKGVIWSPSHGDTAFTVPLFDEFMRRIMPGDDWKLG